jgi:hypothetical protein
MKKILLDCNTLLSIAEESNEKTRSRGQKKISWNKK